MPPGIRWWWPDNEMGLSRRAFLPQALCRSSPGCRTAHLPAQTVVNLLWPVVGSQAGSLSASVKSPPWLSATVSFLCRLASMRSSKQFGEVFLSCAVLLLCPARYALGKTRHWFSLQSLQTPFAHPAALGLHSNFSLTARPCSSGLSQPLWAPTWPPCFTPLTRIYQVNSLKESTHLFFLFRESQ